MTDEEKNIFGNQLRERRNELNLTTQKVALDAEVGESTYKRLEAGDGNPRLDTLNITVRQSRQSGVARATCPD